MTKSYFNNAIVGNSRMLGCVTDKGELIRLFWPNIDYPQHIDRMLAGIYSTDNKNTTIWMSDERLEHSQRYVEDTNILETVCTDMGRGIKTVLVDFVLPEKDILVRRYEISNVGESPIDLGFILYSSGITTTPELLSSLFDFGCDALIHYRHGYYISLSADREVSAFQLGNNALDAALNTELMGYDSIGMMPDGAVSWKLGNFMPGEKKLLTLSICTSGSLKGVKKLVRFTKETDMKSQYEATRLYWTDFIENARNVSIGSSKVDSLYKRSLLVFKLMSDDRSGGLLAAPEIDEGFTKCGRYAYCWGRDAAFITGALDKCGLTEAVDRFYRWAVEVQDEDGSWQQRYYMDGNLAPSWGLQIDETGTLVWGMLKHYEVTQDIRFLESVWQSAKRGIEFMLGFLDGDTGLPRPSFDLWEERVGEHTYSSAAVYGGIKAGAQMGRILGKPEELLKVWENAAAHLKESMEKNLWKEDRKCFLRSVRVKFNPWGDEASPDTVAVKVNPKGYYRNLTLEDPMVDVSLLGVSIPFDVFEIDDYRVTGTVEAIERILTSPNGGIRRYEWDSYIGGNPWILTTLWVALYHARRGNFDRALSYFEWAVGSRTKLGLLPEQVDRESGEPAWVIPLTWSHAMFVHVLFELLDRGAI